MYADWLSKAGRRAAGLHSVYVITTITGNPVKIGIAENPPKRFAGLQSGNWIELVRVEHWWMAGKPLSERVEKLAMKKLTDAGKHIRGEWFNCTPEEARAAVIGSISDLGFEAFSEAEITAIEAKMESRKIDVLLGL